MRPKARKELEVPVWRKGRQTALRIVAFCMMAVALFFSWLSVYAILNGFAVVAPTLWLVIFGLMVGSDILGNGIWRWPVDCLGMLIGREVIWYRLNEPSVERIYFGLRVFGVRLAHHSLAVPSIETVDWGAGQGTGMVGRDMDDWYITIWFDHGREKKRRRRKKYHRPDQDSLCLSLDERKDRVESFAMDLVEFLREAGAHLVKDGSENRFVRRL